MKNKYRNIFLIFGVIAIVIMFLTFDMDYQELWTNVKKASGWFPAVIFLWVVIYFLNACAWFLIIRNGRKKCKVPFWTVYKVTISGFALNYATPVGLMGGEPYRIMEMTPFIGASRATSSVILYVMTHIFSHFCFWLFSIVLFIVCLPVNSFMSILLSVVGVICLLAIYFFMKGYRNGMAVKTLRFCQYIPFLKKWAKRFSEMHQTDLEGIDAQIAELHSQRKSTFISSVFLEFTSRIIGCLEVFFILKVMTPNVSFINCILIMAFTSLFANLFFFSPMQLGAREGGFAISTSSLALKSSFGLYMGLITRLREFIWIVIGVALMKIGNKKENQRDE